VTETAVEPTTTTDPTSPPEGDGATFVADPANVGTFQVKVGGETMEVSLEEALQGYQRQADYTQKTQALAVEREQLSQAQQLWNAIEANPETTISQIAEAYGFKLSPAQVAAAEAQQAAAVETPKPSATDDHRWTEVQQFMQQAQQNQLQMQVQTELAQVHARYGVAFDDTALVKFAVDRGISNLDDAFKAMSFDAATKVAQDRQIASRKAGVAVAGGHSVAAGSVASGQSSQHMSLAEAFAAAEAEQLG
jgi:hypothetical protein